MRSSPPPALGGSNVATSTAEEADCNAITAPPSSTTAADIASATTSAICHGPEPIQPISTSPTPTPTDTPTTSSSTRRSRCPSEMPRQTTAAMGAKNGCSWPTTSVATSQDSPAASADCAIGSAVRRHRVSLRPSSSRTARTGQARPSTDAACESLSARNFWQRWYSSSSPISRAARASAARARRKPWLGGATTVRARSPSSPPCVAGRGRGGTRCARRRRPRPGHHRAARAPRAGPRPH